MLVLDGVEAGYGPSQVLFGVSLEVKTGEVVTLIGRNGMGKTTTIRALMGLIRPRAGTVTFDGQVVSGLAPHRIARLGIGLVPEGRQVFPTLTVEENLIATAANRRNAPDPWTLLKVYMTFPRLQERRRQFANTLSGGEQQMLAISRALMTNPSLLILDEATEGLAPIIRDDIWTCISALKEAGQSILVIDKNLDALVKIADRHVVLEKGRVVWTGTSDALREDWDEIERRIGV